MPFVMLPMSRKGERRWQFEICSMESRRQRHRERKRQKTCVSLGFDSEGFAVANFARSHANDEEHIWILSRLRERLLPRGRRAAEGMQKGAAC